MLPLSYQSDKTFVAHGLVPLAAGTKASEATNASTDPAMTTPARRATERRDTRTDTTPSMEWSPANGRKLRRACTSSGLLCRCDDPRQSDERAMRSDPREDHSSSIEVAVTRGSHRDVDRERKGAPGDPLTQWAVVIVTVSTLPVE